MLFTKSICDPFCRSYCNKSIFAFLKVLPQRQRQRQRQKKDKSAHLAHLFGPIFGLLCMLNVCFLGKSKKHLCQWNPQDQSKPTTKMLFFNLLPKSLLL